METVSSSGTFLISAINVTPSTIGVGMKELRIAVRSKSGVVHPLPAAEWQT
jgi:hypothetical protein